MAGPNSPDRMREFEEEMMRQAQNEYDVYIQREDELPKIEHTQEPIEEAEGAPTQADIDLWKKQFPDCKIFRTVIAGHEIIFRTMNRAEYKQIVSTETLNQLTREETICTTCSLWPHMDSKWIGLSGAGICGTLAQLIMELSGFCEPDVVERLA